MKFKNKNKNPFAIQINSDPKKSAEFFNMAMTTGFVPTGPMAEEFNGEDLDFHGDENVYFYTGKVYARENDEYITTIMKKVTANSKEEAIKKIIRFFKIEHIESLLKYFRGYKTNVYIEEDKVKKLGFTKEFERYLDLMASKQKEVETKVDDPKYNFDDYGRKDNYIVEENQGDLEMEFEKTSLYLFPELTDEDLEMVKAYGLNFIGKNYGPDGEEENWIVTGQESQLKRYAQNWLGYELHPDYFYEDEDDFAGDVEVAVTESKSLKETFYDEANDDDLDDIQTYFYDDEAWEDSSVSARKDFDAEGQEFTWVRRHGDVEHLDFDNWAVWEAYSHDDAKTYYFIVDEDTGFIDWGPVDTLEEAQEFLASKVSDWENMDESYKSNTMKSKLTEALKVNQGDLVDFGSYGKLYVCNPNYHDDYYWVTDEEESRMDKNASGWSIEKDLAEKVIESAFDDEYYNESYVDNTSEENSINLSDAINDSIVVFTDDVNSITGDWVASQYKSDDEDDILEAAEAEDKPNSPKIIVSRQDLDKVIDNLKSEPIKVVRRKKNKKFMSDYTLTDSDVKSILNQLEAKDYSYSKISTNELHAGDVLTIFITDKQFTLSDKTLDGLTIYIKVDDSDEGLVTVVSIHAAGHQDDSHSYNESKSINESSEETPYTKEEIERDLKSITHNFIDKEGELKCGFEEEKNFGVEILKKHYKVVEVSGDDRRNGTWYHISYAEPKINNAREPEFDESKWEQEDIDL